MFELTEKAAAKIKGQQEFLAQDFLRVAVRSGGCSGFVYDLHWQDHAETGDNVINSHGVYLLIDPDSLRLLDGATLDFKEGLMNTGFVFNNPNATRGCGCGKSFS